MFEFEWTARLIIASWFCNIYASVCNGLIKLDSNALIVDVLVKVSLSGRVGMLKCDGGKFAFISRVTVPLNF